MGDGPISELQRLTVSLRGGFEHLDGGLVLHFTGQLDAYSEKQFIGYVTDVLQSNQLPIVLDLGKIDFLDSSTSGWEQAWLCRPGGLGTSSLDALFKKLRINELPS